MGETYLNKITTRVPGNEMHEKFLALIPRLVPLERDRKIFARLSSKAQIESRYSVLRPSLNENEIDDEGFYVPGAFPSTSKRMALYEREAITLAEAAASEVLEREDRHSITHLIITTCTGFVAPGLDLELQRRLGLRSDLERTVIGFMGCYAAMNALKCASSIVRARPDAKVLCVNLELCSIHFQEPPPEEAVDFEQLLAFLQFADGCAASLVSREPVGLRIDGFRAEVLPEKRELIQWRIGDMGFHMRLSLEVPTALGQSLSEIMTRVLAPRSVHDTTLWAIHPGGRAILDVVQEKLDLSDTDLAPSREVLRRYGNMSSATVMFVLRSMLHEAKHEGYGLAMAFGPGLTLETMRFTKARG